LKHYDPEITPNPQAWLELDEGERIQLAERHHVAARVKLPNAHAHAVFHAIVENQIALNLEPVVRAVARLKKEGLSRHDAIHAVSNVLAEHLFDAAKENDLDADATSQARYNAAVERLSARQWREKYGSS
jgi:post-segregation antitoxin (ccd killing protein)